MRKIIVMGGSFNPPTTAHIKLMSTALEYLKLYDDDVRGIFVPSSDMYVKRKTSRQADERAVLPEMLRLEMLKTFIQHDSRIIVDNRELGTTDTHGHTLQTLEAIQEENLDAQIYFIFGGDKLKGLSRWRFFDTLVSKFKIILFDRDGENVQEIINEDEALCKYRDRFIVLKQPDGINAISSTAVWKRLQNGERVGKLLTHEVYTLLLAYQKKRDNTILCFQGDSHFLSNFHRCIFKWNGISYTSAEAAFQSAKCSIESERNTFCHLTPGEAKIKGRQVQLPRNWENIKEDIMERIVHEKFFQNPCLAKKLMETGDAELIEGNTWGDTCWGVDLHTMQGQNRLGKILMKVRNELFSIPKAEFDFRMQPCFTDSSDKGCSITGGK